MKNVNPWIVTISVMLATFMEVLDTTVVNVSIPHIAGNLARPTKKAPGSSPPTWSPTPSSCPFPAGSPATRPPQDACSSASPDSPSPLFALRTRHRLTQLIIFRVLQGLAGGGLQPLAQAILLETFPKESTDKPWPPSALGIHARAHSRPHARRLDH